MEPTVLADVSDEADCMNREIFAPVAPLAVFDSEEEIISRANACDYRLTAYAFTREMGRMFRLAEQIEAGTIGINDGVPTVSSCLFGGFKHSGLERKLGWEGLDAFLEIKRISIAV